MKKNINTASDNDLNELDRLVTQEIDALQQNSGKKILTRKTQKRKGPISDNVIFREGWPKESESTEQKESAQEEYNTDKVSDLQNYGLENEPAFIEDSQTALGSTAELFTEEEQDFIQRSTDWLSTRENKDMIISRIWEQVTESVPESFYSVDQEVDSEPGNLSETNPQDLEDTGTNPPDLST